MWPCWSLARTNTGICYFRLLNIFLTNRSMQRLLPIVSQRLNTKYLPIFMRFWSFRMRLKNFSRLRKRQLFPSLYLLSRSLLTPCCKNKRLFLSSRTSLESEFPKLLNTPVNAVKVESMHLPSVCGLSQHHDILLIICCSPKSSLQTRMDQRTLDCQWGPRRPLMDVGNGMISSEFSYFNTKWIRWPHMSLRLDMQRRLHYNSPPFLIPWFNHAHLKCGHQYMQASLSTEE
jgi:hypothetical protein